VPIVAAALTGFFGKLLKHVGTVLIVAAGIATPLLLRCIYLRLYEFAAGKPIVIQCVDRWSRFKCCGSMLPGRPDLLLRGRCELHLAHRYYRDALAKTSSYRRRRSHQQRIPSKPPFRSVSQSWNEGEKESLSLINCALNVTGLKDISMRRLTDFFLFSPAYCGSPLIGLHPTQEWRLPDPHLDLGQPWRSPAPAAPQMGLGTMRSLSFCLFCQHRWAIGRGNRRRKPVKIPPGLRLVQENARHHERTGLANQPDGWRATSRTCRL